MICHIHLTKLKDIDKRKSGSKRISMTLSEKPEEFNS